MAYRSVCVHVYNMYTLHVHNVHVHVHMGGCGSCVCICVYTCTLCILYGCQDACLCVCTVYVQCTCTCMCATKVHVVSFIPPSLPLHRYKKEIKEMQQKLKDLEISGDVG